MRDRKALGIDERAILFEVVLKTWVRISGLPRFTPLLSQRYEEFALSSAAFQNSSAYLALLVPGGK